MVGKPAEELEALIEDLSEQMHAAAAELHFELAARFRDEIGRAEEGAAGMQAALSGELGCGLLGAAWRMVLWGGSRGDMARAAFGLRGGRAAAGPARGRVGGEWCWMRAERVGWQLGSCSYRPFCWLVVIAAGTRQVWRLWPGILLLSCGGSVCRATYLACR